MVFVLKPEIYKHMKNSTKAKISAFLFVVILVTKDLVTVLIDNLTIKLGGEVTNSTTSGLLIALTILGILTMCYTIVSDK